jgi:WhiB family redox-sensing transcriptional regulator
MEAIEKWSEKALCASHDPERWFPVDLYVIRTNRLTDAVKDAMEICSQCPVIGKCHDYAKTTDQRYGIWGGVIFGMSKRKW